MNIWTPEHIPPQLAEETVEKVGDLLLEKGLTRVYGDVLPVFQLQYPLLREYFLQMRLEGFEDHRPVQVLRTAAVITSFAYLQSGYDQPIDERVLVQGQLEADLEGVPDAYLASVLSDANLRRLMDILTDAPELQDGADQYDYAPILELGAGCVRHFFKQAVAA
jgi:hypothetical protein